MSRFLIVVPPLAGHVNPTVAVGRELQRRGHEVAWAGHPDLVAPLLPAGCRLWPAGGDFSAEDMAGARARWLNLRAFAALAALWDEVLIPLGAAMVDGVEAAVDGYRPDVVVADQQALAGAVVGWRRPPLLGAPRDQLHGAGAGRSGGGPVQPCVRRPRPRGAAASAVLPVE